MIGFIKKNTPNTLTCCNLIAGAMATYQAFGGQTKWAFLLIVIGAVLYCVCYGCFFGVTIS